MSTKGNLFRPHDAEMQELIAAIAQRFGFDVESIRSDAELIIESMYVAYKIPFSKIYKEACHYIDGDYFLDFVLPGWLDSERSKHE